MKFTIMQLANSESYEKQADLWAKGAISVAFGVALLMGLSGQISLGLHWLWMIPVLLFGSSLLLAMPTMLVHLFIVSLMSPHMTYIPGVKPAPSNWKGRILLFLKNTWSIVALFIEGIVVYLFLDYVSSSLRS